MEFTKTSHFDTELVRSKIMGPNTLKLCEELMGNADVPAGSVVLDLGSGYGISSAMLARMLAKVVDSRAARLHA